LKGKGSGAPGGIRTHNILLRSRSSYFAKFLPEEWLIERIQQVGTNSRKPFSPSFGAISFTFAAIFRDLRDIFVTASPL
jgi:hypothetical protein